MALSQKKTKPKMPAHIAANSIVSLVNVLSFAVIQTIFFVFVASREIDRVVEAKSRILMILRQQLQGSCIERGVNLLDWQMHELGETAKRAKPEKRSTDRWQQNRALLMRWIGPVLMVLLVAIVALSLFLMVRRHGFPFSHRVGLALVLCVYIVEILLFVFVIERYTMVGDYELLQLALRLRSS